MEGIFQYKSCLELCDFSTIFSRAQILPSLVLNLRRKKRSILFQTNSVCAPIIYATHLDIPRVNSYTYLLETTIHFCCLYIKIQTPNLHQTHHFFPPSFLIFLLQIYNYSHANLFTVSAPNDAATKIIPSAASSTAS